MSSSLIYHKKKEVRECFIRPPSLVRSNPSVQTRYSCRSLSPVPISGTVGIILGKSGKERSRLQKPIILEVKDLLFLRLCLFV